MNEEKNYSLEEYKLLKDEVKSFTNQGFNEFQLFVGILAIFFTLIGSKDNIRYIPKFACYAFMQLAVFIFIIIQFNRTAYLLIIRKHLADLEKILNKESNEKFIFRWESKIVPTKIAPMRTSYISQNQIVIGGVYLLIFLGLCCKSYLHSKSLLKNQINFPIWFYYILVIFEGIFIFYSLYKIYKLANS